MKKLIIACTAVLVLGLGLTTVGHVLGGQFYSVYYDGALHPFSDAARDFSDTVENIRDHYCSATSFLRNWDSILEKKRANLRSISEPARLRQPPPRSTGAAHARGRAQSIREERRIAAPPVLFALLWVRLLPALYGPFCGPLRPFGGCPWGVTPPARECLPPAPPDTRRRG